MTELNKSEERIQQEMVVWLNNTYPLTRGLLCYNLNNSVNEIDGNRNKSKGLRKGRADLVFYWKSRAHMIEVKTANGRQHKEQKEWQILIEKQGFKYYIVRDLEEFKQLIEKILHPLLIDLL